MIAQTLLQFRADTSQARAEIKKLAGDERKAAEETLAANERRNASYEGIAAGLTKLNAAMAVVSTGVSFAADAWKTYDEMQDLAGAKGAISIEGLRKASRGLKTDLDLLKLAAVSQTTTFKLSQSSLEQATRAMRTFEEAGYDGARVQAAMENAIKKGSIEPLKELGVNLELARDATGKYNQLLDVLAEKSAAAGDAELSRGDKMKQSVVAYQNAITELKSAVGELVLAFQPVIAVIADVASGLASLVKALPREVMLLIGAAVAGKGAGMALDWLAAGKDGKPRGKAGRRAAQVAGSLPFLGTAVQLGALTGDVASDLLGITADTEAEQKARAVAEQEIAKYQEEARNRGRQLDKAIADSDAKNEARFQRELGRVKEIKDAKNLQAWFAVTLTSYFDDPERIARLNDAYTAEMRKRRMEAANRRASGASAARAGEAEARERAMREAMIASGERSQATMGAVAGRVEAQLRGELAVMEADASVEARYAALQLDVASGKVAAEVEASRAMLAQQQAVEDTSYMERFFGPIDEFNAYATAFDALNSVATQAFAAWTQGATLTGKAMRQLAADSLAATAQDMFGKSLQHAAYAIGALAMGGPIAGKSAAQHGKAAAAFAAGSIIVGGLARKLNVGEAAGAGASGGAGSYGAGGAASVGAAGSQRDMGRITNLYVGDMFSDDNPRTSRQKFARMQRSARRELDAVAGVEYR
jgi:hypothetical protein